MGGKKNVHGGVRRAGGRELRPHVSQPGCGAFDEGLHKAGVVEVLTDLVHLKPAVQPGLRQGHPDVFAVLAAAGVTGVGTRGDHQQSAVAGVVRVLQGLRNVGVPVAVAPQHGKLNAAGSEL